MTKANHEKEIRLDWDVRRFGDRQHAPNVVGRRRDLIFWSSALTGGRRHWNLGWLPYGAGDLVCLTTASGLLPAGTAIQRPTKSTRTSDSFHFVSAGSEISLGLLYRVSLIFENFEDSVQFRYFE